MTLARDVRERLFQTVSGGHSVLQRSLFHAKTRERCRDKIRLGLYTASASLTFLYYLFRPFRLARKYLWRPVASRPATTS